MRGHDSVVYEYLTAVLTEAGLGPVFAIGLLQCTVTSAQ